MPFKARLPGPSPDILVVQDEDEQTEAFRVDDDSNTLISVQDKAPPDVSNPGYLTEDQELLLVDAGPVFRGPPGPSLFDVWRENGHPNGTVDDFFESLRGPPGAPPSAGGTASVYEKTVAESTWLIAHNLGRYPSVTLVDTFGEKFDGDITYIDQDTIRVTLIAPAAGSAFLN